MRNPTAETFFKNGIAALSRRKPHQATSLFKAAVVVDRARRLSRPHMRYLSYYGLSLALAHGPTRAAIWACEKAAAEDSFSPEVLMNLGKVLMMDGQETRALSILEQGLRIAPGNQALASELADMDRRSSPPFRSLPRSNPLNRWVGRLKASLLSARKGAPQEEAV